MIATGSVSAALKVPSLADTYTIMRQEYPHGKIIANIGAGTSVERAKEAIRLFHADALQIHLNAPQELVMPEETVILPIGKYLFKKLKQPLTSPSS